MKDGWLIISREVLCSWTHLQHLEEDIGNQNDAENMILWVLASSWLTLWQHRRKTCHWRWLTASGKAQWMGWHSSGSPPPACFCQSAEPLATARTQTRQRVEGSPMSIRMYSTEDRNFICRGNVKTEFEIYLTFFLTLTDMLHHAYLLQKYFHLTIWKWISH